MDKPGKKALMTFNAAIIVCSDRASAGTYVDRSSDAAANWLKNHNFNLTTSDLIPDNENAIVETVLSRLGNNLIVISGGTGLGPRDLTPQTLDKICDYQIPGFGEILRKESLKFSLNAYLSRCGGWVKNQTLILGLPGNPKAVEEQLEILADLLPHALTALLGKCAHRRKVNDDKLS